MVGKKRRKLNNQQRFTANLSSLIAAAENGVLESQHDLAAFYATDDLCGFKDEVKAVEWYTRAAEAGHAESQYDLGFMLLLGEGTEKDVEMGLRWMKKAVAGGSVYAAKVLSDIYEKGLYGVGTNSVKAAYWSKRERALSKDRI